MKFKKSDSIINFDVKVTVHGRGKRATVKDTALAKKLQDQAEGLLLSYIELLANKGSDEKVTAVEYAKNKYYLGAAR